MTNELARPHLAPLGQVTTAPDVEDDLARWLRAALLVVDKRRDELAAEGDWEALAHGLAAVKTIADDLRALTRALEDDVARLLPAKRVEVEGLGVIERRRATTRRNWQSLELLDELIRRAIVDPETGSIVTDDVIIRQRIVEILTDTIPFTGSLGWRIVALRDRGIDPAMWCEETPGRETVQIIDNRSNT